MTDYICDSAAGVDGAGTLVSPWNNANAHVGNLVPGDRLLLRGSGDPQNPRFYTGQILVKATNGCESGTAGNPITITNYPGEYVRIVAASSLHGISIEGLNYWIVSGTDSTYGLSITQNGWGQACLNSDGSNNVTVKYVYAYNVSYDAIVRVRDSDDFTIEDSWLRDNDIAPGTDHHGIMAYPIDSPTSGADMYRFTVRRCLIEECAGDCVVVERQPNVNNYVYNVLIEDNRLICHLTAGAAEQCVDLKSGNTCIVRRNLMSKSRYCNGTIGSTGSGSGSACLAIAIITETVDVYDNTFTDYSCAGVFINRTSVNVFRNLFYGAIDEAAAPGFVKNHIYITHVTGPSTVNVIKNTFVGRHGSTGTCITIDVTATVTVNYRNNLHSATGTLSNTGGTLSNSYNGWFASPAATWAGTGDVSGASAGFVDAPNNDYRLLPSSTARNAGTAVSPFTDGASGGIDLGCFESSAAAVINRYRRTRK